MILDSKFTQRAVMIAIIALCWMKILCGAQAPSINSPQTANTVLAGPTSGGAAVSSFRVLGIGDLPGIGATGTSGGIPYFSSTTALASSGLLASNFAVFGGGAGTTPASQANANASATFLNNGVTSGAGTAFIFDTTNAISGNNNILSVRNATTELFKVSRTGAATFGGGLSPSANDSGTLGAGTAAWSDLFLASGGVINFNNSNFTLTHTSGTITASGTVVANAFSGPLTGNVTGNADTATSAATLTTPRAIYGSNFDGSAAITGPVTVPFGGTGIPTTTAYGLIAGGTTATGNFQNTGTGTSAQVLISQGASALPTWNTLGTDATISSSGALTIANLAITNAKIAASTIDLTAKVTGALPVTNGGTALTAGTSGGILGYTATGTLASSAALAANAIVIGGGAGATPTTTTTGTGVLTALGNTANTASGFITGTGTVTSTNKRNQPRITSASSYTTDTGTSLDVSTTDIFVITAQAGALKFNNPSGTPVQGEKFVVRCKDSGAPRALTYDTQFRASSDLALPTTTVTSKTLYMLFIYNSTDTKWDLLAVLNNF